MTTFPASGNAIYFTCRISSPNCHFFGHYGKFLYPVRREMRSILVELGPTLSPNPRRSILRREHHSRQKFTNAHKTSSLRSKQKRTHTLYRQCTPDDRTILPISFGYVKTTGVVRVSTRTAVLVNWSSGHVSLIVVRDRFVGAWAWSGMGLRCGLVGRLWRGGGANRQTGRVAADDEYDARWAKRGACDSCRWVAQAGAVTGSRLKSYGIATGSFRACRRFGGIKQLGKF